MASDIELHETWEHIVAPEKTEHSLLDAICGSLTDFFGLGYEFENYENSDKWKIRYASLADHKVVKDEKIKPMPDVAIKGYKLVTEDEPSEDEIDGILTGLQKRRFYGVSPISLDPPSRRCIRGAPRYRVKKDPLYLLMWNSFMSLWFKPKLAIVSKLKPHSRSFSPASLYWTGRQHILSRKMDEVDSNQPSFLDDSFFSSYKPPDHERSEISKDYDEIDFVEVDHYNPNNNRFYYDTRDNWVFREKKLNYVPNNDYHAMQRVTYDVKQQLSTYNNSDRIEAARSFISSWVEKGLFAKCFNVRLDKYYNYKWKGDEYVADQSKDHRPGFTLWLTFIQIILCLSSLAVYGLAPIGFDVKSLSSLIIKPNLALEKESYLERENLWIGPRQADLIHLGAKYSPCMRLDANVVAAIDIDRSMEYETACCINNDGSGCVQTSEKKCSRLLATWSKFYLKPGSVCGQDPKYCKSPASTGAFAWPDDITKWPICYESHNTSSSSDPHMSCDVVGRPCCYGIQGECRITTREHCTFLRGYFHEEASLCSQVDCLNEICGMIPFGNPYVPDQFYRFWTCLFLHAGILHLLISLVINFLILWPVERMAGWIRTTVIFCISGIGGSLASSIFLPYHVEAGPAGAHFGIIACHLVTIILFMSNPKWAILKMIGFIVLLLFIGLLPMVDNYAHIFGFGFGFLTSYIILPFARIKTTASSNSRKNRIITIVACTILLASLITVLIILFYVLPIYDCPFCHYVNCIPLTNNFCSSMKVKIRNPVDI